MGERSEERDFLERAAGGDARAVRRLVDEIGPVVFGYVFARVGGDRVAADDIVQDVFLEALRGASTFRGDAQLATWMCAIARRRVLRHYESERRQAAVIEAVESALAPAGGADDAAGVTGADERADVVRALGRLPQLHRQVLVLKYLDDCPVASIAAELGRTPVQIQSLLQRARAGLRRQLEVGV